MKKGKFLIFLVVVFSFFCLTSEAKAYEYYTVNLDASTSDNPTNFINMFMENQDSALTKYIFKYGGAIVDKASSDFNGFNNSSYVFQGIGFADGVSLEKYIPTCSTCAPMRGAITKFNELEATYAIILYINPKVVRTGDSWKITHEGAGFMYVDNDMNILGTYFGKNGAYATGNQFMVSVDNSNITDFFNFLFASRSDYVIPFSDGNNNSKERYVLLNGTYENVKFTIADSSQQAWYRNVWKKVSSLWDFTPSATAWTSLPFSYYMANPIASLKTGYKPPLEGIFGIEVNDTPDLDTFDVVDLSENYYGYYFVPISSNDNILFNDVVFKYMRTEVRQDLIVSTIDVPSSVSNSKDWDFKTLYLSYTLTKETSSTYTYYELYGRDLLRDVNLSTSQGISYDIGYYNTAIYMYTDYVNAPIYVYYDSTKYKAVEADTASFDYQNAMFSNRVINDGYSNLRTKTYSKLQDYVGYNYGPLYELGSYSADITGNGYDNYKDCAENSCLKDGSIGIFDDPHDTNLWEKDNWDSLDDIIDGAYSSITALLASVSAIMAMCGTILNGLPSIISSTFMIVFVTGMTLLIIKILI